MAEQFRFVVPDGTHAPPAIPLLQRRAWDAYAFHRDEDGNNRLGAWTEWETVPVVVLSRDEYAVANGSKQEREP